MSNGAYSTAYERSLSDPDGFWGEFTDNGPATGYNYLTLCCVALYWEHSRDPAALVSRGRIW